MNDGEPDSRHLPPSVQIYGTAEVETDKLAPRSARRALQLSFLSISP